jgi:hypothetical protein
MKNTVKNNLYLLFLCLFLLQKMQLKVTITPPVNTNSITLSGAATTEITTCEGQLLTVANLEATNPSEITLAFGENLSILFDSLPASEENYSYIACDKETNQWRLNSTFITGTLAVSSITTNTIRNLPSSSLVITADSISLGNSTGLMSFTEDISLSTATTHHETLSFLSPLIILGTLKTTENTTWQEAIITMKGENTPSITAENLNVNQPIVIKNNAILGNDDLSSTITFEENSSLSAPSLTFLGENSSSPHLLGIPQKSTLPNQYIFSNTNNTLSEGGGFPTQSDTLFVPSTIEAPYITSSVHDINFRTDILSFTSPSVTLTTENFYPTIAQVTLNAPQSILGTLTTNSITANQLESNIILAPRESIILKSIAPTSVNEDVPFSSMTFTFTSYILKNMPIQNKNLFSDDLGIKNNALIFIKKIASEDTDQKETFPSPVSFSYRKTPNTYGDHLSIKNDIKEKHFGFIAEHFINSSFADCLIYDEKKTPESYDHKKYLRKLVAYFEAKKTALEKLKKQYRTLYKKVTTKSKKVKETETHNRKGKK